MLTLRNFQETIEQRVECTTSKRTFNYLEYNEDDDIDLDKLSLEWTEFVSEGAKAKAKVRVYRTTYDGNSVVIKAYTSPMSNMITHELTISKYLESLNLPNYPKVYGIIHSSTMQELTRGDCKSRALVMSYCPGMSLGDWLCKHWRNESEVNKMLQHVFIALESAYVYLRFTHYDLYTSNILVCTLDEPKTFDICIKGTLYEITSRYYPVIIDFGMSRVTCEPYDAGMSGFQKYGIDVCPNPSYDIMRLLRTIVKACPELHDKMIDLITGLIMVDDGTVDWAHELIKKRVGSGKFDLAYQYWPFNLNIRYIEVADYIESS